MGIKGRLIMAGSNFAAGVAVLSFVGHWIDKKTGHEVLFAALGGILGVIWGVYELLKLAFFLNKSQDVEGKP